MACPLPEDVKKRALEKCASYPYLTVQDPGTLITGTDGRELVFVLDNKQRGLWLEVAPPRGAGEKEKTIRLPCLDTPRKRRGAGPGK